MLLKKVWGSVSSSSRRANAQNPNHHQHQHQLRSTNTSRSRGSGSSNVGSGSRSSTGAFDRIPDEILVTILKRLGPKEAAKLCLVCRGWRELVSSSHNGNLLWVQFFQPHWDSVFFAETHLSSGKPLIPIPNNHDNPSLPLPLVNLYGLRHKVPGALLVDGGSGYCKFGWSKYPCPSGRSATFLEFGNIEAPMYSRLRHFYATIYSRMQVKPSRQPVVVSIPICHYDDTESARASRRQLKEAIHSALFDMNVPAVCAIDQATLALFAARRTSGIVVNVGFHQTCVVPILHGKVMRKVGVEIVGLGAFKVTGFLREQMQHNNIHFESLYTVRELKENLCYVAYDYDAEFSKDTQASYEVSGEGLFTLSKERFQTGEMLFQPHIAGVLAMGLHHAIALCMDHCHAAELTGDDSWFKTVVLCGGTACLPGLAERLEKELHELLPASMSSDIRVISPPHGVDSAWHGAKLISNLSTFPEAWCVMKNQFKWKSRRNRIASW